MRTYRQYCGLAKALDVVGDRWTLLIVRELLILGPSRYTDLRNGLPGIATNLLVDRLRELEEAGVVERTEAPPPVAATLFRLTPHGEALRPVIEALGAWAGPELESWDREDEFRGHWLALPLDLHLVDRAPTRAPVTIEVRTGNQPIAIEVGGDSRTVGTLASGIPLLPLVTRDGWREVQFSHPALTLSKSATAWVPDRLLYPCTPRQ